MAKFIVMPKLGLTMTEGKLFKWYKKEGDVVQKGDKLFVAETDKLTNDIEATQSGILAKIIHKDGTVPVLEAVGIIADPGEDISQLLSEVPGGDDSAPVLENTPENSKKDVQKETKSGKRIKASPKAKKLANEMGINLQDVEGTGPSGSISEKDILNYKETDKINVKASPAAEKVAEMLNVDINNIQMNERVMKNDVVDYWNYEQLNEIAQPEDKNVEMSSMRKVISERMMNSQSVSATVNYNLSVDTTEMQRLRKKLKPIYKVTYTDIIAKILSKVLMEYPRLNCSVVGDEMIMHNYVNMGVAVALDEGLIVPVIKYSNVKGLQRISEEIKDLANKAKTNQLTPDEMIGGTFTISNLGMFNMESFTPIINQPEVAILGINTIKEVATKVDGELKFVPLMNLSLSADHRVIDGSVAAQFMNRVKEYIENPSMLML